MQRKFEKILSDWKEKYIQKPLMVVGVRQIGKTYTIDSFCKKNFPNYLYINLEKQKDICSIFDDTIEPEKIIERIKLYLNISFDEENTVLFFDECQVSENFITSLKYFCESKTPYKIVCAGSLLGVKINRFNSSFPVGKVRIEYMYPMDFEEFLMALDEKMLIAEIKKSFQNMKAMDTILHEKAMELYQKYLCVGGMPEVVNNFLENKGHISELDSNIIQNIIDMYVSDMSKYTTYPSEKVKIENIYKNVSTQLAKENKKFQYSIIEKGADKRKYYTSIEWLISSNMVYACHNINKVEIPLKVFMDENNFKLYLSDVGLLTKMSGVRYNDIIFNVPFMYRGVITENYVAQNFIASGIDLYYWTSKNLAEIDFLLYNKDGIIPVEVKSNDNNQSKSLKTYMEKYNPKYAIRISSKNFGYENKIMSIPLYAIFCIKELEN